MSAQVKKSSSKQPRRAGAPQDAGTLQASFFARMGYTQQFRALLEHLPDVYFFAKDAQGRFMAFDRRMLQRLGFPGEAEVVGKTDGDIHPPRTAQEIRDDDRRVMETRQPLIDRVEMLYARSHANGWYATTKLPILTPEGEVIGVMGFVRPYRPAECMLPGVERLERVTAHIHRHHAQALRIEDLARLACLSQRQLNRLFHSVFGMSTQAFIMRTRVEAASESLRSTNKSLSEIAIEHGFCDQSAFSRRFSEHTGETPLRFRQRHRRSVGAAMQR